MSENYDTLSDRELIVLANCDLGLNLPVTVLDDNAARLVRNRIAELDLKQQYWSALQQGTLQFGPLWIFDVMQATPRQQYIAALNALGDTDGR